MPTKGKVFFLMRECRCRNCNKLMFRYQVGGQFMTIEIKCDRCGLINTPMLGMIVAPHKPLELVASG